MDATAAALPADTALLEPIAAAAIAAGEIILAVRARGLSVERKQDFSPVTEADRAAEALIVERLAEIAPGMPVIAEESVAAGRIPEVGDQFFLVDPLDGTREFVNGGNDFTVNVGLVRDGAPVLGVIYLPASGKLFAGVVGEGAWRAVAEDGVIGERRAMHVRPPPEGAVDIVASRSHRTPETDAFIARYQVGQLVNRGSSIKFCALAEGKADLYPRMGTTMQWDTAAGDAILRAAGGRVLTLEGTPLPYGPTDAPGGEAYKNPWFIATGGLEPVRG
jgi:3'(2'), 5'-bisphosphate nucleotidase